MLQLEGNTTELCNGGNGVVGVHCSFSRGYPRKLSGTPYAPHGMRYGAYLQQDDDGTVVEVDTRPDCHDPKLANETTANCKPPVLLPLCVNNQLPALRNGETEHGCRILPVCLGMDPPGEAGVNCYSPPTLLQTSSEVRQGHRHHHKSRGDDIDEEA
jgi:hypothetical protein